MAIRAKQIAKFSDEELATEIERRRQAKIIEGAGPRPVALKKPNLSKLVEVLEEMLDDVEQYGEYNIYAYKELLHDHAIEAIYGKAFNDWCLVMSEAHNKLREHTEKES